MKKAYVIMVHKSPAQVYRLINRLNDGESEFFVHIDKKADINQFRKLESFGGIVHFTERFDATWGGYGIIKPSLSALRTIRDSGKDFKRIMLLSGQDYPIKSNADIDRFFETSPYSNFIDYTPIPNYKKWPGKDRGGLYRVDKYYFGMKNHEVFLSKTLNFLSRFFPFIKRKLPNGMKPYTGQTWWNLDMYALNYILDYSDNHPEYMAFHKNTFVADELFVQMIIGNSQDTKLINSIENSEKRFTIWYDPTNAHPKILAKEDFETIKLSTDLFARKFDESFDSEILDMIDDKILNSYSVNSITTTLNHNPEKNP
jgi:hypothetical protein